MSHLLMVCQRNARLSKGRDSPLTYDTVVPFLLTALPELQQGYAEEQSHWDDEPITPYILAMMVINPALHKLLERNEGEDTLRRAFAAIEILMQHPNEQISTFAATGMLEFFVLDRVEIAKRAEQYMGPSSRTFAEAVRAWHADFQAGKLQHELRAKERARTARTRRGRVD